MTNANENSQSPDSEDRLTTGLAKGQGSDDENGLPSPAGEPTATVQPEAATRAPKRIGHYHVKRVLASGGMGTVYEATQEKPHRAVAVKPRTTVTPTRFLAYLAPPLQILARGKTMWYRHLSGTLFRGAVREFRSTAGGDPIP